MTEDQQLVVGGVDTHKDEHVAVALTTTGRRLGAAAFPATTDGYVALRTWLAEFGDVFAVGVVLRLRWARPVPGVVWRWGEGARGVSAQQAAAPSAWQVRRGGCEAAARTAPAGEDLITPKSADGPVETMRALRLARRSAIKARNTATNQLHALIVTAPNELRERLGGQPIARVVPSLLDDELGGAVDGYGMAMLSLARRWRQLDVEAAELRAAARGSRRSRHIRWAARTTRRRCRRRRRVDDRRWRQP